MLDTAPHRIEPLPAGFQRSMVVVTTLLISVMASLDMTIVSVALPYMGGNLSASPDEITWVITMYTVAQAITVGVSGHLARLFGRKRLAVITVIWFVACSAACGLAQSLGQIVLFRFMQGLASGPVIPISQSVIIDAFPPAERTKGLSLWSIGVMGGPAAGPAIGGYLAQHMTWRWCFWVNLPVGALAILMILKFFRSTPPQRLKTDWTGFSLLLIMVVCLQIFLDQGDKLDWFGSRILVFLAIAALTGGIAFFWRGLFLGPENIINLRLLSDRNFSASCLLVTVGSSVYMGLLIMTPTLLVDYFGWEVSTSGVVIGVFGVGAITGSIITGRIAPILGVRTMAALSLLCVASGWYLFSLLSLNAGPGEVILPGLLIEFGLMLQYAPVTGHAFKNLAPELSDEGAGLFNFIKTLGMSFGSTFVETLIYRGTQANWSRYVGFIGPAQPGMQAYMQDARLDSVTPQAGAALSELLSGQMYMLTCVQVAEKLAFFALFALSLILFMERDQKKGIAGAGRGEASPVAL